MKSFLTTCSLVLAVLSFAFADFSNDVRTIHGEILRITHPEHRLMSLQGFAAERGLTSAEMADRLLAVADSLRDSTNAPDEAMCRYAIWGVGHFGSDKALVKLEDYVLSDHSDAKSLFSTTPLQLAALMAYERITHGDNRLNELLARAKSAGAIDEIWADSFIQKSRSSEVDVSSQINKDLRIKMSPKENDTFNSEGERRSRGSGECQRTSSAFSIILLPFSAFVLLVLMLIVLRARLNGRKKKGKAR